MSNNKVLKNGFEVKLQRNALGVVEHPARNELEDDVDSDSSGGSEIDGKNDHSSSKSELLVNLKVKPLIQHSSAELIGKKSTDTSYKNEPEPVDVRNPTSIGTDSFWQLQELVQSPPVPVLTKMNKCRSVSQTEVNLEKLRTQSLWRYCNHYQIVGINADSSREQMLNAVQQHFRSQPPLDELQVVADFFQAVKRHRPKNHGPKEQGNGPL